MAKKKTRPAKKNKRIVRTVKKKNSVTKIKKLSKKEIAEILAEIAAV